jgi:hypothetical protein
MANNPGEVIQPNVTVYERLVVHIAPNEAKFNANDLRQEVEKFFRREYNWQPFDDVIGTLMNRMRDAGRRTEHLETIDFMLRTIPGYHQRDPRNTDHPSYDRLEENSENEWRICTNLLIFMYHGAYMSRNWSICAIARSRAQADLNWLRRKRPSWEWASLCLARLQIFVVAEYQKKAQLSEEKKDENLRNAEIAVTEGLRSLRKVKNPAKKGIECSLYNYRARIIADQEGLEKKRCLNLTADYEFELAVEAAKEAKNSKLAVEITLNRIQYLLACNNYLEFVHHKEIDLSIFEFCQQEIVWMDREHKSLISQNKRTLQLFNLTLMNMHIRSGDLFQFNQAAMQVMDGVLANPDSGKHVYDRCTIVLASWMKSPLAFDEIVPPKINREMHRGDDGVWVYEATLGHEERKVAFKVQNIRSKITAGLSDREIEEKKNISEQYRKKIMREVLALE